MKTKIWIYEYKDDETPIGATLIDDYIDNLVLKDIQLPKLRDDWCWKIYIEIEK